MVGKNDIFVSGTKTYHRWMDTLIKNGILHPLEIENIEPLSVQDSAETQCQILETEWSKERVSNSNSLLKALNRAYGKLFYLSGFIYLLILCLQMSIPIILNQLLTFLSDSQLDEPPSIWIGVLYAVLLFLVAVFKVILDCQYFYMIGRADIRMKCALKSIIYKKMLKLTNQSKQTYSVGNITSLISIDAHLIGRWLYVIHDTWQIPLLVTISLLFSLYFIGWATFAGLLVMMIFTPMAAYLAYLIRHQTEVVLKAKDERSRTMNELLKGIRVIKCCAMEKTFQGKIHQLRSIEYRKLFVLSILETLEFTIINAIPIVTSLVTFSLFGFFGGVLTTANVFTTLALLNKTKDSINRIPHYVSSTTKGIVSVERIKNFLLAEEIRERPTTTLKEDCMVEIQNGCFEWNNKQSEPTLKNINMSVRRGHLVSVIGEVGSGKSSLLGCLFGDLDLVTGSLNVQGKIAYCPQEPWILNSTLRDNVLCGKAYQEDKYLQVLRVCGLEPDLKTLKAGDMTEIGEKGINLSGGQKARVSLARACYQDADLYLLDSPLSAVDVHVADHIYHECLTTYLAKKTVILVTHSLKYLKNSDSIIWMENGSILHSGSHSEMIKNKKFETLMKKIPEYKQHKDTQSKSQEVQETQVASGTLIEKEEKQQGTIHAKVFVSYFLGYSIPVLLIVLGSGFFNQCLRVLADAWLSIWTSQLIEPDPGLIFYITCYLIFTIFGILTGCILSFSILMGSLFASSKLHNNMLSAVINAPISFFDITPIGRILNRFSKDQHTIDVHLSSDTLNVYQNILQLFGIFAVILYVTPWFALFVIPIAFMYWIWQKSYRQCSREVSRLKGVTMSPILNHISGSASGISSIRAYQFGELFMLKNQDNVNTQGSIEWCSALLARWLAFRLEFTACLIIFCSTCFVVLARFSIDASLLGLAVTYALSLTHMLNWFIKVITQMEQDMVSVERTMDYATIASEKYQGEIFVDKSWPSSGYISFQNVTMRYRPELPLALNGISFEIKNGEKIGVCGRTGAGKSSITLALFRIFEIESGKIEIDHQDISKVDLTILRKNIAIVTQDPVIFTTSIRRNLDPFDEFTDFQIWRALENLNMKTLVESFPKQLNEHLFEDGSNLSVGQKQLFCLCRCMLRNAKIVIMDESTSNIDIEYDLLIQKTIRHVFKDCTVITIAHRMNTISDYDKVMVIDNGKVVEFDDPRALSMDPSSSFSQMLNETKK